MATYAISSFQISINILSKRKNPKYGKFSDTIYTCHCLLLDCSKFYLIEAAFIGGFVDL